MSLSTLELNTIRRGLQAAKRVVEELQPVLLELNIIYDADGGVKSTVTQDNLTAETSLSGLTKQQLDDGMYALTATLRTDVTNAYAQLAQLAARA